MSSNTMSAIWNPPNIISFIRILLVPVVMGLLTLDGKLVNLLTALFFIVVCLTDWLDGYLARKMNIVTSLGKFLDPLADKLLIAATFIMLIPTDRIAAWVVALIICREIAITGLRAVAANDGIVIAASSLGKLKTISQIVCIVPLIIHHSWYGFDFHYAGTMLMWVAFFLTMYSGADYFVKFSVDVSKMSSEDGGATSDEATGGGEGEGS